MSDGRPSILPDVLAAILDAAPGRVRKRIDKEPSAAHEWAWESRDAGWIIAAGDERVSISAEEGVVRIRDRVSCTCLLSPNCFHVLSCVTTLRVEIGETASSYGADDRAAFVSTVETPTAVDAVTDRDDEETVAVTPAMRDAANRMRLAAADLLRVGARGAGTLVQSSLLRAGHQCRAADLPALGNAALRVAEGVRLLRMQNDAADTAALRQDLFAALEGSIRTARADQVEERYVGTLRREYDPTSVSRLEGWFAEPVLTRSGYAGICVRLLTPSGEAFQVLDLRPGDSQLVLQAYAGGIDLGATVESGRSLCRKVALVQRLGASADGRLGRGTGTRWVMQGQSGFDAGASAVRFAQPLGSQIEDVFRSATLPPDRRRGGWDCLAFKARLLGSDGASLIAEVTGSGSPWKLRIAVDRPELPFRENLELLARCPGLCVQCVGRIRPEAAGEIDLLAIGPGTATVEARTGGADDVGPRLVLPEEWQGRCNLGLDRLHQRHFDRVARWPVSALLADDSETAATDDGLASVSRRLDALALGGWRALPARESVAHRRDASALVARGQGAAALLINRLGESAAPSSATDSAPGTERRREVNSLEEAALACSLYLGAARTSFHRERWLERISER